MKLFHTNAMMISRTNRQFSWPLLVLLSAGCGEKDETASGAEGGAEIYASPEGAPLPFQAAVPEGVVVERETYDRGSSVTFVAASGETRDERAFLHFVFAGPAATEAQERTVVRTAAESYRVPGSTIEIEPVPPPPWAVVKYPIESRGTSGERVTGWVALGSHNGRWFHLLVQHPESLEERVTPVLERILSTWRWTDTGEPLHGAASNP